MTTLAQGEVARGSKVVLREKRLGDAWNDYHWRSQPELSKFDAARALSITYPEYMALFREEILYPSPYRRSLAIETEAGQHIGNIMYYNIDALRQEAELGVTIGETDYWGKGFGTEAVRLLVEHLLGRLGFRRVYLKTLDWNDRAQRSFQKAGFAQCGRAFRGGNGFTLMEIRREWLDAAPEAAEA